MNNFSKYSLIFVTALASQVVAAQVNFFECAKDPDKCRVTRQSNSGSSVTENSEIDRSRLEREIREKLEQELRAKIALELELKERERLKSSAAERDSLEQEIRVNLSKELQLKEKERVLTSVADRAKLEQDIRQRLTNEFEGRERDRLLASTAERVKLEQELRNKYEAELALKIKEIEDAAINDIKSERVAIDKSIRISTLSYKKALIIGNDSYQFVPKLQNARADAQSMALNLSNLGYQVTLKTDLTDRQMRAAIRNFKKNVNGGDEVLFFYAGHGIQLEGANYLLPTDIKGESEDQVKDEAVQLQRLLDDMNDKSAKFTLALIDACRDNPFPKRGRAIGGRGLAPTMAASGQMIIFSAGSGQQALDKIGPTDKNPNGLFTRIFLDEMYVPGERIDNVVREVRKKVVEAAKTVGHEQVPAIYDQVVGDFYFIPPR